MQASSFITAIASGRLGSPAAVELAGLMKISCLLAASKRYLEFLSSRTRFFSCRGYLHGL
jgi:hypothetical protein